MCPKILDLKFLSHGSVPAISKAVGAMLAEAGGVCLEAEGHNPTADLTVTGNITGNFLLNWSPIPRDVLRSWQDEQYTTEQGACAVAVLLADQELDYRVIRTSARGTGFDYWMGDADTELFQDKARLEVSGIRQGTTGQIHQRVRQKLRQTKKSDSSGLPVYVVVVEFGQPRAQVKERS